MMNGEEVGGPELPEVSERMVPGGFLIRRAVSLTILLFASVLIAGVTTASFLDINVTVDVTGELEPVSVARAHSPETAIIAKVFVEAGDSVRAGWPLVQLESFELRESLKNLEAEFNRLDLAHERAVSASPLEAAQRRDAVVSARASVTRARANLLAAMAEKDIGTNVDSLLRAYRAGRDIVLDRAISELRIAEASLRNSKHAHEIAALAELERDREEIDLEFLRDRIEAGRTRMQRLTVRSPADGIVLTEQLERLEGSRIQEGDLLLEIANIDDWRARLFVSETDVHRIQVGDTAQLEVPALRATEHGRVKGVVKFVAPQPMADAALTGGGRNVYAPASYLVEIDLTLNGSELLKNTLRRGYSVSGQIVTRSESALRLVWQRFFDGLNR